MGVLKTSGIVLFTAVVVALLPGYLKPKLETNVQGSVAPGWEEVEAIFRRQVESGEQKGGAFSVYHRGERVVNLVGGYADPEANIPWAEDTISQAFSSTKGVSALVIAMLVDRGLLDYKEKVTAYWPEFAENDKGEITIEQLFSHQAGLVVIDAEISISDVNTNSKRLVDALGRQKPVWRPGEEIGYHSITIGLYQDQIVRRVDPKHRGLAQFFKEELADQLGLDFYIGLPLSENWRCARVIEQGLFALLREMVSDPRIITLFTKVIFNADSLFWKTIIFPELMHSNKPNTREAAIPSANGFGTADSLAKLYGLVSNGGSYKGKKFLSPGVIDKLDDPVVSGSDVVLAGLNFTYGRGFLLLPDTNNDGLTFGTPGAGGQMAYGDLKHRLGWSYISNFHSAMMEPDNCKELKAAMYKIVTTL